MAVTIQSPRRQRRTNGKRRRLYTADDLFKLPSDFRCELVRGEIVPLPPSPGGEHGSKIERIGARASVFVYDHDLGECFAAETGFKVRQDPDTVRGPDWSFVRKSRLESSITKKHIPLVPDIVLEVRSPDDSARKFADRAAMWVEFGVPIVWALDPDKEELRVHREHEVRILGPDDTLTGEEILPGFELPLSKVFR